MRIDCPNQILIICLAAMFVLVGVAQARGRAAGANTAIRMARKACWEKGPITPAWRLRIDQGHFDARKEGALWHIRLVESPARKCPVVDATVTVNGENVTCTLTPCYSSK
jgi:hypothetical protein